MILLERTGISLLGCTMVILMLKGAISYARESQYPSNAHVAALYMDIPGVPMWPVIAVRTIIWPVCRSRSSGSVALMKFTCPKNRTSN